MAKTPEKSAIRSAYLRRLGNPYASLEVPEDDFEISSATQRYYRELQNPYAKLSLESETDQTNTVPLESAATVPKDAERATLSKAEFRARCRQIFVQYIPHMEKGRLRPHHRRFISRNESRGPRVRALLARELAKYDLSTTQGVQAYFNREREVFTDDKLKQIERMYGDD